MKFVIAFLMVCAVLTQHIDCFRQGGTEQPADVEFDYNDRQQLRETRGQAIDMSTAEFLAIAQPSSGAATKGQSTPAAVLPGAEALRRKIKQRVDNSSVLSLRPDVKDKILNYANARLNACKTAGGDGLDKHCVSLLTGLIMQLIASMEHMMHQWAGN